MTAFAIAYGRNRTVVASDSLGYIPDRREVIPLGFISKVLPLPHLKAVLFSRGQYQILVRVMAELLLAPQALTIEAAAEALPDLLRAATDVYCAEQGIDDPAGALLLEVTLTGWSETEGRMRLWQFINAEDYALHNEGDETYMLHAWPALPKEHHPRLSPTMSTKEQLVTVIQAIGRYFEAEPEISCGMRVGGEILATEITPKGLTHTALHRFPTYLEHSRASAAIVARIERGDLDVSRAVADGVVPMDEAIDPSTGQPYGEACDDAQTVVAHQPSAAGLTRQQRRAAERKARKAA